MIDHVVRVVIDTNVWVSVFINPSGPPGRLIALARQGWFTLVMSAYLIEEIREVCRRDRIRRRLRVGADEIDDLLQAFRGESIEVELTGTFRLCRDPDDDAILETAVKGQAHYLVSRNDDLKRDPELIRHLASHGVTVISVARFLERLDAEPE
jgi:putative PIN family toxin of toxin-antitoxin system